MFLYKPAAHALHGPPLCPVNPALHRHCVFCELPDIEVALSVHCWQDVTEVYASANPYVLAEHSVQICEPIVDLIFPAAHAVQRPSSGPV